MKINAIHEITDSDLEEIIICSMRAAQEEIVDLISLTLLDGDKSLKDVFNIINDILSDDSIYTGKLTIRELIDQLKTMLP